jgi:hypothetical protein
MALSNVMISFIVPYSCRSFNMCSANADCGFLLLVGIWLVDSVESMMMHGFGKYMSMKNSKDTIGNRNHDLPAYSTVIGRAG